VLQWNYFIIICKHYKDKFELNNWITVIVCFILCWELIVRFLISLKCHYDQCYDQNLRPLNQHHIPVKTLQVLNDQIYKHSVRLCLLTFDRSYLAKIKNFLYHRYCFYWNVVLIQRPQILMGRDVYMRQHNMDI
jgi:hypothetical protein